MFFYEWLVPVVALLAAAAWMFYLSVRNRAGAGVRTEGRIVLDKVIEDENPPS